MDSSDSRTPAGRFFHFLVYHAVGLFKSSQTAPLVFFHAGWIMMIAIALQDSLPKQGVPTKTLAQVFFRTFESLGGVDENGHGSKAELMEVYGRLSLMVYLCSLVLPFRRRAPGASRVLRPAMISFLVASCGYGLALVLNEPALRGGLSEFIPVGVGFSVLAGGASLWANSVGVWCESLQNRLREPEARSRPGAGVSWSAERVLEVGILLASCAWAFLPPAQYWVEYSQDEGRHARRKRAEAPPKEEVAAESPAPAEAPQQRSNCRGIPACTRECAKDNASACSRLGSMYEGGLEGAPDSVRAAELFGKACDLGDAQGCTSLGWLHDGQKIDGADPARAAELFQRGCEADVADGCEGLAYLYESGRGVPKDLQRYVELLEQACTLGDLHACANAAGPYRDGEGVPRNVEHARELLKKACAGGVENGCEKLQALQSSGM